MNTLLNKKELEGLIETFFYDDLTGDEYAISKLPAIELLTHNRLDLAFKLLYLENRKYRTAFSEAIYIEHIRAFTLGRFIEPSNNEKNTADIYLDNFHDTFESIKKTGFDSERSLVPLSGNGTILNGAHRVASAIYLDKEIGCVHLDNGDPAYGYKFFHDRNISREVLEVAVTKFIESASNVYIAMIWPATQGKDEQLEQVFPNIIYRNSIKLNQNGAHNLLSQIYYGEKWLGNVENNYSGVGGKLVNCFKTFDPVRTIAFQADSLEEVLKIKDKVRDIFNIGKHSIHITDTKEEALRTARIIFNENSIHFLNHAKPNKFLSTHKKLAHFKEFIQNNNLDSDELLLDSSLILSLYGLREANDIDYFAINNSQISKPEKGIDDHDDQLVYHDQGKSEMILNPGFYFYFDDLKFISLDQLYAMKKNRGEPKDIYDCTLMESLLENSGRKKFINKLKQLFYYKKIVLRQKFRRAERVVTAKLIGTLKLIGLYAIVKKLYRDLKGSN